MDPNCPFCSIDRIILLHNEYAISFEDAFPVNPGHILIVPRRHVADLFELTQEEILACWDLLKQLQEQLRLEQRSDGFNVGVNVGGAAGQTIFHVHWHLIPRYQGDQLDPRGGIRNIFPAKAQYWK